MSRGGLNPRLEVGDWPVRNWLRQHVHAQQWLKRYAGVVLLIAAGIFWSYQYAEQLGIETIRRAAVHRIDIYDTALKSELARYAYLPSLVNLNPEVVRLLLEPSNAALTICSMCR